MFSIRLRSAHFGYFSARLFYVSIYLTSLNWHKNRFFINTFRFLFLLLLQVQTAIRFYFAKRILGFSFQLASIGFSRSQILLYVYTATHTITIEWCTFSSRECVMLSIFLYVGFSERFVVCFPLGRKSLSIRAWSLHFDFECKRSCCTNILPDFVIFG